jgi:cytoskeletal protein CcmA (bactofilin family)
VPLDAKPLDTIVGRGTHLEGVMKVENNVRIDGVFKGELSCRGTLTISLCGAVQADLEGTVVVVRGTVHGSLRAEKVHLDSQARFFGDVHTRTLSVDDGAFFHGSSMQLEDGMPERQVVNAIGH